MPRFLLALTLFVVGACSFDAKYSEGVPCGSDQRCPSGLICHQGACLSMIPIDMPLDEMPPEGPPPALTCADPGIIPSTGGTANGTTAGGTSKMSSLCSGTQHLGADRVYKIMMNGQQLRVSITGMRKAYVILACTESPNTPNCLGATRATEGNPIVVTTAVGPAFIVVDDDIAAAQGTYSITLTVL